jgi:acetylornithine/N-succinyldiaminopimelate aminotransferase
VGLLRALEFDTNLAPELAEQARAEGLLVNAAQPNVVRFMPSLRVTPGEVDLMLDRLEKAYAKTAAR